jgi:hypothetical protein
MSICITKQGIFNTWGHYISFVCRKSGEAFGRRPIFRFHRDRQVLVTDRFK